MSLLIRSVRTFYVLGLALLVVALARPGSSRCQFRGNNMPGAPLRLPAPAPNFGAGGFAFGVVPGFGFNGFGFNGIGFAGVPFVGFPGIGGFNGFGGVAFNGVGFNGFGMVPGFGFNGFGMVQAVGVNGFGFNGLGFAGFPAFGMGGAFPGVGFGIAGGGFGIAGGGFGIAGVPRLGLRRLAPVPFVGGFAGKGFGGFSGGRGL
jgi:hypothetical protein